MWKQKSRTVLSARIVTPPFLLAQRYLHEQRKRRGWKEKETLANFPSDARTCFIVFQLGLGMFRSVTSTVQSPFNFPLIIYRGYEKRSPNFLLSLSRHVRSGEYCKMIPPCKSGNTWEELGVPWGLGTVQVPISKTFCSIKKLQGEWDQIPLRASMLNVAGNAEEMFGAEFLLGNSEMLFLAPRLSCLKPVRQCMHAYKASLINVERKVSISNYESTRLLGAGGVR